MSISACEVSFLNNDTFGHISGFLTAKELARAQGVCRSWNQFIGVIQWKEQCQNRLNIPASLDPRNFLPRECVSYKTGAQLASTNTKVFDAKIYRRILGAEIELAPPLLEAIPLAKSNEPDPCDPTKTKGENYVWMDSPSYFNIPVDGDFPFELDKPDDPNDEEAPKLIPREPGSKPEKKILKIPNTINNLGVLFEHPRNGNPSEYYYVWEAISSQHGNKRISAGRICMREDVFKKNISFARQQAAATNAGVIISQLGHRVLFNFLRHAETDTYPDGDDPRVFARTSTVTVNRQGIPSQSSCGCGRGYGLCLTDADGFEYDDIGAAVVLPEEGV